MKNLNVFDDVTVEAVWTGREPNLCSGSWILIVNGVNVTSKIPEELRESHMNTYGEYAHWDIVYGFVEWSTYTDGLDETAWLEANDYWLKNITSSDLVKQAIFTDIQKNDFRPCCCGGCI